MMGVDLLMWVQQWLFRVGRKVVVVLGLGVNVGAGAGPKGRKFIDCKCWRINEPVEEPGGPSLRTNYLDSKWTIRIVKDCMFVEKVFPYYPYLPAVDNAPERSIS